MTQETATQLYLISPEDFQLRIFAAELEKVLATGCVSVFQLRLKGKSDQDIIVAAQQLQALCRDHQVSFILNDRVDLAAKIHADGVHLGAEDGAGKEGAVADAKKKLGKDAIVGVSCYDSKDLAMQAAEDGADYVSFGAFYASPTKQSKGKPTLDLLKFWSTYTIIPCVAIGGITKDNIGEVSQAGADFAAVISCVWNNPLGPVDAIKTLYQAIS